MRLSFSIFLIAFGCFFMFNQYERQPLSIAANDDCEEWIRANERLRVKADMLQEIINDEQAKNDRNVSRIRTEVGLKKRYQALYESEKKEKEHLIFIIEGARDTIDFFTKEVERLKRKKEGLDTSLRYAKVLIEATDIQLAAAQNKLTFYESLKGDYDRKIQEKDSIIRVQNEVIGRLESEANDKVLTGAKEITFDGELYGYGEEILFVPFANDDSVNPKVNEDLRYKLERLKKMIDKYDSKVKLRCLGVSSENNLQDRKYLASSRPENLRRYMKAFFGFKEKDFQRNPGRDYSSKKELGKRGVYLILVKR